MQREKIYYTKELAEILGVDRETVRRYLRSGKLSHYKYGKEYVVKQSQLDSFLEKFRGGEN